VKPGRGGITYKAEPEPKKEAKEAKDDQVKAEKENGDPMEIDKDKGKEATTPVKQDKGAGATADKQQQVVAAAKRPAKALTDVFVMRITGEVFESYEDYLVAHRSYCARKWSCRYTGASNLTFEEALQSETKHGLYSGEMPATHVEPALRVLHHSLLNTEMVVRKIVSTFTGQLVPGESVMVGEKDYVVVEEVEQDRTPEATGSSKHFKLREKVHGNVLPCLARELIKRKKHPLNKHMVRKWLYDVAENKTIYENKHLEVRGSRKKNAWFVLPDLAKKFSLPEELPFGLSFTPAMSKKNRDKIAAKEAREKRKLEEKESREAAKKVKKMERNPNVTVLKHGSMKFAAFEVLKNAGDQGLSVNDIIQRAQAAGLRDFSTTNAAYNKLFGSLCAAPHLFTKIDKGIFCIRKPSGEEGDEGPIIHVEGPRTPDERDSKRKGANGAAFTSSPPGGGKPKESHMVKIAKAAVQKLEERVAKAEEAIKEITNTIQLQAKEKPKKIEVPPELIWNPELETFTGDEYDRKAVMGHRKWVETEKARMAHEADLYVKQHKQAEKKAKLASKAQLQKATGELYAAREQLKKAQKVLVKAESISLIKSGDFSAIQLTKDKDLQRELERERVLAEKKMKREEEKEQNRLKREKEMEERRRLKEIANLERRFPLEDKLLVEEINKLREKDLPIDLPRDLPEVHDAVDSSFVKLCEVATCLFIFGKMLGMQPLKFHELAEMVKLPGPALAGLYRDLLSVLLLDGSQHPSGLRRIRRWIYTMTSEWGCVAWPDVLARYILTKPGVGDMVKSAACQLQEKEYQKISYEDHVELLRFLLDDVVETRLVHEEIDRWQEEREDFISQKREARMDLNRKRRERAEAEKEKRRKIEEEKKKKKEEILRLMEEARDRGEDATAIKFDHLDDNDEDDEDDEERFQIPEEKLEYQGDPMDRKAVLAHRKWVEAEKTRLSREYEVYIKEKHKRQREEQIRLKEEQKAIEEEESTHDRMQDALDRELDKRPIRLAPLGLDRNKVKYYWNMAGQKTAIYAQSPETGDWKCFSDEKTLDDLLGSLDSRGKRESILLENMQRKQASIRSSFGKEGEDVTSKPARSERTRSSSRLASVPNYSENGSGRNLGTLSSSSTESDVLDCEQDSLEFLGHELESIAITADKCNVPYVVASEAAGDDATDNPGWKPWLLKMKAALKDEEGLSIQSIETLLLDMEDAIWNNFPNAEDDFVASGKINGDFAEMMDNSSSDEEIDERSLEGYAKMKRKMRNKLLWFSNQEREAWKQLVTDSKTVSQVGYCAAVLEQRFTIVQRTMSKKKGARR